MTRIRPTAAAAMISVASTRVTIAAAGIGYTSPQPSNLATEPAYRTAPVGHVVDRVVGDGEKLGHPVDLTDQGHAPAEDVVRGAS